MKIKDRIILCGVLIGGMITGNLSVKAYNIYIRDGFSPVPTEVYGHNSFSGETETAIHNSCLTWNGAGVGDLVYRSTFKHTTTEYPCLNSRNEITKGYRGENEYLMATSYTLTANSGNSVREADIDINISHPMGSASTSYDIRTSMTHELGHLLGLDENPDDYNSVMYPSRGTGVRIYNLTEDDKAGIKKIYN